MRRDLARVLCIFPFEEAYFEDQGVAATYIGHPLHMECAGIHHEREFFRRHTIDESKPPCCACCPVAGLVRWPAICPHSADAAERIRRGPVQI